MKAKIVGVIIAIALFAGLGLAVFTARTPTGVVKQGSYHAVVYMSPSCGCCSLFVDFLKKSGMKVKVEERPSIEPIKRQYGVPAALQSCPTTIIGEYFIEGHMPLEAIEKLKAEKPDIAGIALAGMPAGSPGMPGTKTGPFVVYAGNKDGTYEEFMKI